MKRLLVFGCALAMFSCQEELPKDYATISGSILNADKSNVVSIIKGRDYKKDIVVNADGTFSDTLKVVIDTLNKRAPGYMLKHGDQYAELFIENDNTLKLSVDFNEFDETLKFEGDGADKNNFYASSTRITLKHLDEDLFDLPENQYNERIDALKADFETLKGENADLGQEFLDTQSKNLEGMLKSYNAYYQSKLAMRKAFPAGSPSPVFENYENHKGGTTSLSDLAGKYVYVDVWATWCGPCKREIPSLKKIEEEFHGKNIEFVSISVDDERRSGSKEKAHESWRNMVTKEKLGGIQLFSDNAWQSDFVKSYKISGIPRFILIDPQGNIVNADAPRPSSKKLVELFNSLNI